MEISIIDLKKFVSIDTETNKAIERAKGFILSEGTYAADCMLEKYSTGAYNDIYNRFERGQRGIIGSTGKTSVSLVPGVIQDVDVIFVHPTSNVVDYIEIKKYLHDIKDVPIVEGDQNLIVNLNQHLGIKRKMLG